MSLDKMMYGCHNALMMRDDYIFSLIAEKYKLNKDELSEYVLSALDSDKKIKSIKLLPRTPKVKGNKKKTKRNQTGYQVFQKESRERAKELLIKDAKERVFSDKNGNKIVVDEKEFSKGAPTFGQVGQKVSGMWWALTPEERLRRNKEANEAKNEETVDKSVTEMETSEIE